MIEDKLNTRISKFLSLVLRHAPERIGIELDSAGWTSIEDLIEKMNLAGQEIDRASLEHVVATNKKKRFAISDDGLMIRANQGHSIEIEHGYEPKIPPTKLYHGTALKNQESILKSGLEKRNRHHVHLSSDIKNAVSVGQRHGKPIVFDVSSGRMHEDGFLFYQSENGVWLTSQVPSEYLGISKING
jgi:putative RNA 2'-phosphotransferase